MAVFTLYACSEQACDAPPWDCGSATGDESRVGRRQARGGENGILAGVSAHRPQEEKQCVFSMIPPHPTS